MNAVTLPASAASTIPPAAPNAVALSAQEAAIENGSKALHGNVTDRVLRIFDAIRGYGSAAGHAGSRGALHRVVQDHRGAAAGAALGEGAEALRRERPGHDFRRRTHRRPAQYLARPLWPRLRRARRQPCSGGGRAVSKQQGKPGEVVITDEDQRAHRGRAHAVLERQGLRHDFRQARCRRTRGSCSSGRTRSNPRMPPAWACARAVWRHSQNWAPRLREDPDARLRGHPAEAAGAARRARRSARRRRQEAVPRGRRHHLRRDDDLGPALLDAGREMASRETNPRAQAASSRRSPAVCARVPEHPARTFREALQAQWFAQMFSRIEQNIGGQVSQGRMDQYFYPFYRKDVAEGRLTQGAGRGTPAVPLAQHDAEHRGQVVAERGGEHGGLRALRADHDRRADARRPRRDQRPHLRDAGIGAAAAVELSRNSRRASMRTRPSASCTPWPRRSRTARARRRC